jgi:hypothetical protein
MSMFDSNDLGMPGYFLPEDSQSRLKKLRDQITFLSRLAQPRTWKEQDYALQVPAGELAICLEALAEQVSTVLDELSWPAQRQKDAAEGDVATAESPQASSAAAEGFAYITLDQFDALDRLVRTLSAHGDVVACSRAAELADHSLPRVGQTIHDGVEAVRAILDEVQAQQPQPPPGSRNGVAETRAVYRVGFASRVMEAMPTPASTAPACAYGQPRHRRPHWSTTRRGSVFLAEPPSAVPVHSR